METVLATQGLTKRYGVRTVVDRVGVQVRKGDIYGFLGPNGAGKTTTLRMVMGLITPSEGHVELLGQDPAKAPRTLIREIGSLVEGPGLYPHLSAAENLAIAQHLKGRADPRERTDLLEMVGLPNVGRLPAERFSLGMKQRLGIAMALTGRPKLLVLDEPTNGLDPEGFRDMRALLRLLVAERGVTILLSSHLLHEVEQVATRVGVIRNGQLLVESTVDDLRRQRERGLEVTVSHPEVARNLITERLGVQVELAGEHQVVVRGAVAPAEVARLLVQNGLDISRLVEREASLENIFLNLTGGKGNA